MAWNWTFGPPRDRGNYRFPLQPKRFGFKWSLLTTVIEGAAALLLCVGLWTPIAGSMMAGIAVWTAFSRPGDPWALILLAAVGVALAMLGPGAWSIDALLFGRRRMTL